MQTVYVDQLAGGVLGDYQIERLLGSSPSGTVYLARQQTQGRQVLMTIFTLPEDWLAHKRDLYAGRIAQEKARLARLAHSNILPAYDFGEQSGHLYLVTAIVKWASLKQALKQHQRFTPKQTLDVLKQVASGLDYAHSNGVVHGVLSHSTVLITNDMKVQIAGFGLRTIFEARGNTQSGYPQPYLFGANGAFLGHSDYVAPECVQGEPVDARSDIYALGVMLFELLSGGLPFKGNTPLDSALQRIQQPVPSVHAVCPDVPEALDLVISKMLDRDPARRYRSAGDGAAAFERVMQVLDAMERVSTPRAGQLAQESQLTLPPTVNWFDEDAPPHGKWQLMPPIVTGKMPALPSPSSTDTGAATRLGPPALSSQSASNQAGSLAGVDPFAWWSSTTTKVEKPEPGTFAGRIHRLHAPGVRADGRRRPTRQGRRQVVKLIATGTAVAGVFAVGGISFAHFVQSLKQSQQIASAPPPSSPATTQGNTPATGATGTAQTPQASSTASKTATPKASPTHSAQSSPTAQPTQQSTAQPTQQPTQQATPKPTQPPPSPTPSHTGTVIGSTSQATNSSTAFTNPADGQQSLLLHLSNGNFVACERACTHAGVPINYDSGSGRLVCPAHGAIFDPTNGFSVVSGPAPRPQPTVTIRVNADGTITTG